MMRQASWRTSITRPPSPPVFWRVHGLTRSTHAEIRYLHTWKSVNLAWAVRISGDGGQEGRHLAKKEKKGYGARRSSARARTKPGTASARALGDLEQGRREVHVAAALHVRGEDALEPPSPVTLFFFFLAKCLPSWPTSPEIRTAHAKFTDFHVCVYRISACVDLVSQ